MSDITLWIDASLYEESDNCLQDAADDVRRALGLDGWRLNERWEDDARNNILVDVPDYLADDLVRCDSADGWSLHAPGSTDEEIASGDAPYLVSGEGEPTAEDYAAALTALCVSAAEERVRGESNDLDHDKYVRDLIVSVEAED